MDLFADTLRAVHPVPAPRLRDHVGKLVTCAGMLTTAKPVHTIRDEPMEFVTFDDGAGLLETVIFPDVYRRVVPLLFGAGPYLLRGRVEESYGAITLTITGLERLERYADHAPRTPHTPHTPDTPDTPPIPPTRLPPHRIADGGSGGEVDA
jgi:DNA polymerase III alpha subunit